jgi:tetratricopeptide (TPR) repeat protein
MRRTNRKGNRALHGGAAPTAERVRRFAHARPHRISARAPARIAQADRRRGEEQSRSADAWSNLGLAFHAQGDYAKAVGSFDRALAIKPDHADVLNNRGTTLNCLGRHEEALEAFARALALRSDYLFRALQPRLDAAQSRTLSRGACKLRDRAGNRAEPSRYVMSSRYVIAAMRC